MITFVRRSCVRPLAAGLIQAALFAGMRIVWPPTHWLQLTLQGVLATSASAIVVLLVGMTAAERQRFVAMPLGRFLRGLTIRPAPAVFAHLSDDAKG